MVISSNDRKYSRYLEKARFFLYFSIHTLDVPTLHQRGWFSQTSGHFKLRLTHQPCSWWKKNGPPTSPETLSLGNSPQGTSTDIRGKEDEEIHNERFKRPPRKLSDPPQYHCKGDTQTFPSGDATWSTHHQQTDLTQTTRCGSHSALGLTCSLQTYRD